MSVPILTKGGEAAAFFAVIADCRNGGMLTIERQ